MISIFIDNETGDFTLDAQYNIINDNVLLTEIYMRLKTPLGTFIYDRTFGSLIGDYLSRRQKIGISQLKQIVSDALQPILNRGDIRNLVFKLIYQGIGSFRIALDVVDSQGRQFTFPFSVK
jgi:phage gp46-like protein